MSNAQDLLSILNASRAANPRPAAGATTSGSTEKSILNFKAGKMTTSLQSNGKYLVEPDKRRGELHVVYVSGVNGGAGSGTGGRVKLEWKDRRTKTVVNTIEILPNVDATFERVLTGKDDDRVYLLQIGDNTSAEGRHFFWMQDKNTEPDEELCVKVNLYLSDVASAATEAGTSTSAADGSSGAAPAAADGMDNAELLRIMQGALGSGGAEGASMGTVPGSNSVPTAGAGQIDALGNILESLGMPQNGSGVPSGETDAGRSDTAGLASSSAAPAAAGGLTLSDLQGAMAGLATASPPGAAAASSAGPPLSELASADIIDESGILDDKDVVERLTKLLPEGQQTEAMLRENIRSPQVAQSLQRLTAALADDAGSFNSIIANFQLDPADGMSSMAAGNPIEAFLNCLLKDVEKKEGVKKPKLSDDKEDEDGGEKKDEGDDGKGEGSGEETKMDES